MFGRNSGQARMATAAHGGRIRLTQWKTDRRVSLQTGGKGIFTDVNGALESIGIGGKKRKRNAHVRPPTSAPPFSRGHGIAASGSP